MHICIIITSIKATRSKSQLLCIFTDQDDDNSQQFKIARRNKTTCKLLVFLILKFRKQFLISTIFCLKTLNRLQYESIYYFFVIIPIKTLVFQHT